MNDITLCVTYFAAPGPRNTDVTLGLARERADILAIRHLIVASDSGRTAARAAEIMGGACQVVAVTNPEGLALPIDKLHDYTPEFKVYKQRAVDAGLIKVPCAIPAEEVARLEQDGVRVVRMDWQLFQSFVRVPLGGVERIGVGTRVALSCAVAALQAGVIPKDTEVIAIAGTGFGGGGADTALVVHTAATFAEFRVLETICRPRVSPPGETR